MRFSRNTGEVELVMVALLLEKQNNFTAVSLFKPKNRWTYSSE
jgi:hypothetical protein